MTKMLGEPGANVADESWMRKFAAVESGDMATFRSCFTPDATVWHNYDGVTQDITTAAAVLAAFHANSSDVRYTEQRVTSVGNVRFVQHVLVAKLKNGVDFRLPAIMRIELAEDGRVFRIEEYFDSRATDCLSLLA